MESFDKLKTRRRSDYYFILEYRTRWADNDHSVSFPAIAELAMRVNKLGKSSVTYELALFEKEVDEVKSVGELVHVFVDRATGRPSTKGMNETMRCGLERILVGAYHSKL
ncbi:hypothetical protein VP1G_11150 [Cytospora mali]|uniref:Uncharacterized protein n=1 Tax=Cytospora mali TaxID=578113 RepID=A0A194V5B5_CYTMA|nr:hypothetical protein VP1G_11150 [Valsa mali var. pyri (nom. inval.)]